MNIEQKSLTSCTECKVKIFISTFISQIVTCRGDRIVQVIKMNNDSKACIRHAYHVQWTSGITKVF